MTKLSERNLDPAKVNRNFATEFTETNVAPQGLQISYNPIGSVLVTSDQEHLVRENTGAKALICTGLSPVPIPF